MKRARAIPQAIKATVRKPGSAIKATRPKESPKNASIPPIPAINNAVTEGSGLEIGSSDWLSRLAPRFNLL